MKNQYGLDANYFKRKMEIIIRDIGNYNPRELSQELDNMKDALGLERICGNCKYSEEMSNGSSFVSCAKNIRMDLYMQHNSKNFGCNKFEDKAQK